MDETQKVLIKAGRKDLAQKYYERTKKAKMDQKDGAKKALDILDKAGLVIANGKLWPILEEIGYNWNDGPEQMLDAWEHLVKNLRELSRKG